MAVLLDEDAFEPALEKVAGSMMPFIKELGIDAVKLPHAEGEIAVGCFDQEMVVVRHEAVGVAQPVITLVDMLKCIEEILAVLIVFEDRFLFVTARVPPYATHLLQANYDIRTIQDLLGHRDIRTTMIYTHTIKSRTIKETKSPLDFQLSQ
jgi:hypothetical protein